MIKMAEENPLATTLNWLAALDAALAHQREKIEGWCCVFKSSTSKLKKRSKNSYEEIKKTESGPERIEEEVDFGEIDKLLERAKSVRVETVEAKKKPQNQPVVQGVASRKHVEQGRKDARDQRKTSAGVAQSNARKAAGLQSAASRGSVRPKTVPTTTRARKLDPKNLQKDGKDKSEGRRNLVNAQEKPSEKNSTELLGKVDEESGLQKIDSMSGPSAEKAEAASLIDTELVNICLKLRRLKKKYMQEKFKNSKKNALAKDKFLRNVEGLCEQSVNAPQGMSQITNTTLGRVSRSSPLSEALAILDWESTCGSLEELQELCSLVMTYIELELEFEGKLIMYQLASNLLHEQALSKSDKINAFRKMYSLLIDKGQHLPTMIDDSQIYQADGEADEPS